MNTIHAPELRSATERCITTRAGIAIGRCYVRKPLARVAGSVSGPHRRPGIAARVLGAMGSMRALFVFIALCAAVLLLSACSGPSEAEALNDNALNLQDAIAQAQAERPDLWTPETIERAKAAALIAAAGRK